MVLEGGGTNLVSKILKDKITIAVGLALASKHMDVILEITMFISENIVVVLLKDTY